MACSEGRGEGKRKIDATEGGGSWRAGVVVAMEGWKFKSAAIIPHIQIYGRKYTPFLIAYTYVHL